MFALRDCQIQRLRQGVSRATHLLHRVGAALFALLFVLLGLAGPAQAQALPGAPLPVDTLNTRPDLTTPVTIPNYNYAIPCDPGDFPGCDVNTTTITFGAGGSGNRFLETVVVGGTLYEPAAALLPPSGLVPRLEFRRAGLLDRDLLFFEHGVATGGPNGELELFPSQVNSLEEAMLSRVINRGIDNVFNNIPGGNEDTGNNIERIDYLITGAAPPFPGLNVATVDRATLGFLILERGGNDAFKIAAITAVDGAGNPSAYGPLLNVAGNAATWGNSNSVQINTAVLRRGDAAPLPELFRPSHLVPNQPVRGIFFPINSLIPDTVNTVFGYSLFATDVPDNGNLVNFAGFPTNTNGTTQGGLDLVSGGFGLIRRVTPIPPPTPGNLFLNKRITQLTASGNVTPFPNVEDPGTNQGLPALVAAGLGQGTINVASPQLQPGDEIEYTLYFNNTGGREVTNVEVCDQIPLGTTFNPDTFGAGLGTQAIVPADPAVPPATYTLANYTNVGGDDPATLLLPGATLPAVCGAENRGNGALFVNVGTVGAGQVGLVRFRTRVNDIVQPT